MHLFILKSGNDYIRVREDRYQCVKLDKASVFPENLMDEVRQHETELKKQGFSNVCIKRLVLTEEDI